MANRDNHYEAAFEEYLRGRGVPYVAVDEAKRSVLSDGAYDPFKLTPRTIAEAAAAGDAVAQETIEETGHYIGLGVATCISVFNPEIVVIGGGIAQAGDLLLEPIRRTAKGNSPITLWSTCRIVPGELGDNAGILGAAALVQYQSH